jgi:hypothetical protein
VADKHYAAQHPKQFLGNYEMATSPVAITICAPMTAHTVLPEEPIFYKRNVNAVGKARRSAEHEMYIDRSFDYGDARKMSVHSCVLAPGRRHDAPSWALNDKEFRRVLVAYFENKCRRCFEGDEAARLAKAHEFLKEQIPALISEMDALCLEYVSCADPARRKKLQIQIRHCDSQILNIRRGPALIVAICLYSYRNGWDSCSVANVLRVGSPFVRQVLHRMGLIARNARRKRKKALPKQGQDEGSRMVSSFEGARVQ